MKKFLGVLLVLVYSCTTTNDGNTTTTTVVPLPPTNLVGTLNPLTTVNLSWIDNSTNETGFKIERKVSGGDYALIGTTDADKATFSDSGLSLGVTYTYRVYAYNEVGKSLTYAYSLEIKTANVPILTTTLATLNFGGGASSGGNITDNGGSDVTERGVVWSTNSSPTIDLSTKTVDGTGNGVFTSAITGLTAGTAYYVRAYATNSVGTSYGSEISFTTPIPIITIGTQTWTSKNLDVTAYSDGTPIPQVTDRDTWAKLTTGAWCYYNNNPANGTTYGKLYNWYAVAGIWNEASKTDASQRKKLAYKGYHVPSELEWKNLYVYIGGPFGAGGKMKEIGFTHWNSPNIDATNSSGFTGLPGGGRYKDCCGSSTFSSIGDFGIFWSSSEYDTSNGTTRGLSAYSPDSYEGGGSDKVSGFSVRCLKD